MMLGTCARKVRLLEYINDTFGGQDVSIKAGTVSHLTCLTRKHVLDELISAKTFRSSEVVADWRQCLRKTISAAARD